MTAVKKGLASKPADIALPYPLAGGTRILAPKKGANSFRILTPNPNGGTDLERTRTTWTEAFDLAHKLDAPIRPEDLGLKTDRTFGEAFDEWSKKDNHTRWGDIYADSAPARLKLHLMTAKLRRTLAGNIDETHFARALNEMQRQAYAQDTIDTVHRLCQNLAKFCVRKRYFTADPMAGVRPPTSKRPDRSQLVRDHLARVRSQAAEALGSGAGDDEEAAFADGRDLWGSPAEVPPHCIPPRRMCEKFAEQMGSAVDWWKLGTEVAYEAGPRYGEIVFLKPEHVDVNACVIDIVGAYGEDSTGKVITKVPKNGRARRIAFPETMQDDLAHRIEQVERDHHDTYAKSGKSKNPRRLLFPAPEGDIMRRGNFSKRFVTPARIAAGWPKVPFTVDIEDGDGAVTTETFEVWVWAFHSLRHAWCSAALTPVDLGGLGLPPSVVAMLAGHATPEFTWRRYVGLPPDALQLAVNAMRRNPSPMRRPLVQLPVQPAAQFTTPSGLILPKGVRTKVA